MDSNSEDSDSDMSDMGDLDSDIEKEKEIDYERAVYKEDLDQLKRQNKTNNSTGEKRRDGPSKGIKLDFVHG